MSINDPNFFSYNGSTNASDITLPIFVDYIRTAAVLFLADWYELFEHSSCKNVLLTDLRDQVQKKIDKILSPPPVKAAKPLPRPDDAPRKKRGGRR